MKKIKKTILALILGLFLSFSVLVVNRVKAKAAPPDTITNLTGYTWEAHNIINFYNWNELNNYNINFISNNTNYIIFGVDSSPDDDLRLKYYINSNNNIIVYDESQVWLNPAYKTIQITGGTDSTNATLIAWLQNNGTLTATQTTTYTITFNANGGTGTPPASVEVDAGDNYFPPSTTTLTPPTQYQYFNGWSTNPSASVGDYYIVVNSDTTLYAIWAYTQYTITYNANGGGGTPPESYTANAGTTINVSQTNPTNLTPPAHKHFTGWSTSSVGTTQTTSFVLTQNTTLYAIWVLDTHTITFNANGGTGTPPAQLTLEYGTTFNIPGNTTNLTREGYTFNGWNTSSTAQTGLTQIIIETNTILYAIWRIDRSDELKIYLNDNLVGQYSIITTGTSPHYMIAFDGFDIALFELYLNGGELSPQYQSSSYILSSNMNNIIFTLSGENIYTLLIYNNDTLEEDWTYEDLVENGTDYIHFYNGGDVDVKIYTRQGINTDTESLINTFKMLFKGANEILNIRFGWITIGGILAIVLSIGVIFFIFKLIRGGL